MKLKDKVAVITGVSAPQGLGMAIANAFAGEAPKLRYVTLTRKL
jgi:NAD(P)-dependent dehydrogenase (short-subunit alcohol dehydrogenase family)